MLAWKYLLMILGAGLFGSAGALVAYDIFLSVQLRRLLRRNTTDETGAEVGALAHRPFQRGRWRLALQLAAAGALATPITESIGAIPEGGAHPGTLYPGIHIATPLADSVAMFDTREHVYSTVASEKAQQKGDSERLSDKLQIMTVAMDGINFFANDLKRSAFSGVTGGKDSGSSDENPDDPPLSAASSAQRKPRSGPNEAKKSARPGACATGFR